MSDLKVGQAAREPLRRLEKVTGKKVVSTNSYKNTQRQRLKGIAVISS